MKDATHQKKENSNRQIIVNLQSPTSQSENLSRYPGEKYQNGEGEELLIENPGRIHQTNGGGSHTGAAVIEHLHRGDEARTLRPQNIFRRDFDVLKHDFPTRLGQGLAIGGRANAPRTSGRSGGEVDRVKEGGEPAEHRAEGDDDDARDGGGDERVLDGGRALAIGDGALDQELQGVDVHHVLTPFRRLTARGQPALVRHG